MYSVKCQKLFKWQYVKYLSLTSISQAKNHYDSLGITPHATQNDIKTAYYKLSMQYHPDKNKGSEAAVKFRDITSAYEVLGNFKLRKLYDKGILHTGGPQFTKPHDVHEEDDAQTKFYKSRVNRHKAPHPSGRPPIYNFDEWQKEHYGSTFEKRLKAKAKYERKIHTDYHRTMDEQTEFVILCLTGIMTLFVLFSYVNKSVTSHDVVHTKNKNVDKDVR